MRRTGISRRASKTASFSSEQGSTKGNFYLEVAQKPKQETVATRRVLDEKLPQSVTAIQTGDMPSVVGELEAAAKDPLPDMEKSARSPESRSATYR